jgi:hypothetical protein
MILNTACKCQYFTHTINGERHGFSLFHRSPSHSVRKERQVSQHGCGSKQPRLQVTTTSATSIVSLCSCVHHGHCLFTPSRSADACDDFVLADVTDQNKHRPLNRLTTPHLSSTFGHAARDTSPARCMPLFRAGAAAGSIDKCIHFFQILDGAECQEEKNIIRLHAFLMRDRRESEEGMTAVSSSFE